MFCIIGYFMLAAVFIGMFIAMCIVDSFEVAITIFGITAAIVLWVVIGAFLIDKNCSTKKM